MTKINLTPLSAVVDDVWGKKGTPERDMMEAQLKEDLQAKKGRANILLRRS